MNIRPWNTEFQGEFGARHVKHLRKNEILFPEPAQNWNRTEPKQFGHKPNRTEPNRCFTVDCVLRESQ